METEKSWYNELVPVKEMAPLGDEKWNDVPPNVAAPDWAGTIVFNAQWQTIMAAMEQQITPAMLLDISRWAKEQMKGFTPPTGWIQKIPMQPIGISVDNRCVLFFQEKEQGFPSHHPSCL